MLPHTLCYVFDYAHLIIFTAYNATKGPIITMLQPSLHKTNKLQFYKRNSKTQGSYCFECVTAQ